MVILADGRPHLVYLRPSGPQSPSKRRALATSRTLAVEELSCFDWVAVEELQSSYNAMGISQIIEFPYHRNH